MGDIYMRKGVTQIIHAWDVRFHKSFPKVGRIIKKDALIDQVAL
jgi:hypothetical protein